MKLSKKTEYGLRFLLSLAELSEERYMGIYQISLRHNIPMKFLEAIAVTLKKSGMLEVKKGAGGGYRLRVLPNEISLLMVYEALEGGYKKELPIKDSDSNNQKAVYSVVNQVINDMAEALGRKTLADIQKEFRDMNESLMYYI
ncbi:RrF2 family transcriptional regulator [Plebeiibacterium sediminum]|uniref:Rrf2 family transcriptional regulator n=1 Tax=Plebeiibacterium sediminum TaxID=2992112 RepID=A0AAE3SHB6_9BACT|nr:Rrf2 family transcriptional regulator [Plebeiobacterium sediminum]MCW3789047.1 Rrf2 family transcriptional regulator [Plebeiobacterium sediminum]